ncbi:hypothetical protein GYMLUDRAFT_248008 [Collybiopsis luxurians FD-317 M1]|uniref:Uncharacterized protein n=1 Tax=Collybiopsis luxurians FD-317 M1 TaxID=944289 RepID=A0A0D0AZT6_9AGAR|nr:hypothetical protein GYMLUDRAFT_248008 [Collybiopsis luxurians FD-317 M1]
MEFGLIPPLPNKLREISNDMRFPSLGDVVTPPPVEYVTSLTFSPEYDDLFDGSLIFATSKREVLMSRKMIKGQTHLGVFACTFTQRSGCSLAVLELKNVPVSDTCVVDLLKQLHSLAQLTVEDPYGSGDGHLITKNLIDSLHTHHLSPLNYSPPAFLGA